MEIYSNINSDSRVFAYIIGIDFISVLFKGVAKTYTYSYRGKAGKNHVDTMKKLARNGLGLNSYINQFVKYKYDE